MSDSFDQFCIKKLVNNNFKNYYRMGVGEVFILSYANYFNINHHLYFRRCCESILFISYIIYSFLFRCLSLLEVLEEEETLS